MNIEELFAMKLHTYGYTTDGASVYRVPGGWIYGGTVYVPEPQMMFDEGEDISPPPPTLDEVL